MTLSEKLQQEKEWRDQNTQEAEQKKRMDTWDKDAHATILKFRELHAEEYWNDLAKEYQTQLAAISKLKQESKLLNLLNQAKNVLKPSGLTTTLYFPTQPYPYIKYDQHLKTEPHYPYKILSLNPIYEPCIQYQYEYGEMQRFLETSIEERTKAINLAKQKPRFFSRKSAKANTEFKYINPLTPPNSITVLEGMGFEWLEYEMSDNLLWVNHIDTYTDYLGNILVKDSRGIEPIPVNTWRAKPEIIDTKLGEAYSHPQQFERLPNFAHFQR